MIMLSLLFMTVALAVMIVFLVKLLTKGNFSRNLMDVGKGRISVFRLFYSVQSDSRNFGGEIVADVLKFDDLELSKKETDRIGWGIFEILQSK
ncbi:hypothetical protein D918_08478 [Trichuris suis]|nr:hypothetical protein D918_08478 [Trichuris suis]